MPVLFLFPTLARQLNELDGSADNWRNDYEPLSNRDPTLLRDLSASVFQIPGVKHRGESQRSRRGGVMKIRKDRENLTRCVQ